MPKKIGLFGGSFDPVHLGHLILAHDVVEAAGLDELIWLPAGQSPLKAHSPTLPNELRLELLDQVAGNDPRFRVSDFELLKTGPSYSVETAAHFASLHPDADLFWVLGRDQWSNLAQWRSVDRLAALVTFLVIDRKTQERPSEWSTDQNAGLPKPLIPGLRWQFISTRRVDISSTEIRHRLAAGQPVDHLLPASVGEKLRAAHQANGQQPDQPEAANGRLRDGA